MIPYVTQYRIIKYIIAARIFLTSEFKNTFEKLSVFYSDRCNCLFFKIHYLCCKHTASFSSRVVINLFLATDIGVELLPQRTLNQFQYQKFGAVSFPLLNIA